MDFYVFYLFTKYNNFIKPQNLLTSDFDEPPARTPNFEQLNVVTFVHRDFRAAHGTIVGERHKFPRSWLQQHGQLNKQKSFKNSHPDFSSVNSTSVFSAGNGSWLLSSSSLLLKSELQPTSSSSLSAPLASELRCLLERRLSLCTGMITVVVGGGCGGATHAIGLPTWLSQDAVCLSGLLQSFNNLQNQVNAKAKNLAAVVLVSSQS